MALFPSVVVREPSRGLREEEEHAEQDSARDTLDAPCNAERSRAFDATDAAVRDEVHDEDAPFDGPLLDTDNASTCLCRGQLSEVDQTLRTRDTNGNATDDTSSNEMTDVLSRALQYGTDDPDECGDLNGTLATYSVTHPASNESTNERASGHGGRDASLFGRARFVEVSAVLRRADPGTHR